MQQPLKLPSNYDLMIQRVYGKPSLLQQGSDVSKAQVLRGVVQAWEQANLMEEMWTEENAQLRAALEVQQY